MALGAACFVVVLVAGATALNAIDPPRQAQAVAPNQEIRGRVTPTRHLRVVDGDAVEDTRTGTVYRLENIDTPETGDRARCNAERALGARASEAARSLISNAIAVDLHPTGRTDSYGRVIALLTLDGRDLGEILIADGLARPWRGRREPWCDARGDLIP